MFSGVSSAMRTWALRSSLMPVTAVHMVARHYGIRTARYKLMRFPKTDEWNLFDLEKDPQEMRSVHDDPGYQEIRKELTAEYARLRKHFDAPPENQK